MFGSAVLFTWPYNGLLVEVQSIGIAGSAESLVLRLCGFSQARAFPSANVKGRIQVLYPRVWIGGEQNAVDGKAARCYRRLVNRSRVVMDTRPRPVFRAACQPRLHGIPVDILDLTGCTR